MWYAGFCLQRHGCPRNCIRRAFVPHVTEASSLGKAKRKPRPGSQETCHRVHLRSGRGASVIVLPIRASAIRKSGLRIYRTPEYEYWSAAAL